MADLLRGGGHEVVHAGVSVELFDGMDLVGEAVPLRLGSTRLRLVTLVSVHGFKS